MQRVRPALEPPGEALPDFDIIRAVGAALGADLGCRTPAEAFAEMASLTPTFRGISHERLERDGPIAWPCRDPADPGERTLYLQSFETPSGKAELSAVPYAEPGEGPSRDFPTLLVTGRRLEHYNSGTMTRRTANLDLVPEELIELNRADAAELRIGDGERVLVESRRGGIEVTATVTDRVSPGQAFIGFHFPGSPANRLTSQHADETTGCPEYKVTAVRISSRA